MLVINPTIYSNTKASQQCEAFVFHTIDNEQEKNTDKQPMR